MKDENQPVQVELDVQQVDLSYPNNNINVNINTDVSVNNTAVNNTNGVNISINAETSFQSGAVNGLVIQQPQQVQYAPQQQMPTYPQPQVMGSQPQQLQQQANIEMQGEQQPVNIPAPPTEMPAFNSLNGQQHDLKLDSVTFDTTNQVRGISSDDPSLNNNGAIMEFIKQNATPPTICIYCEGYHYETRTRVVYYTDSHGHSRSRVETYTVKVTDMERNVNITGYITPFYTLYNLDSVDRYLVSENKLRRVTVNKFVNSNLASLCNAIYAMNVHRFQHFYVKIRKTDDKIKVFPDEPFSKCCRSRITDVIMILTCMCIVFYPVKYIWEKNFKSEMVFTLSAPDDVIFAENWMKWC